MESVVPDRPLDQPARVLGLRDATCIVIGAIIGVGIFFNPSRVALLTGSTGLALGAWTLGGLIALCGALVFAELGGKYHASGAQYEIIRDSYGPLAAFLFVFCNATATQGGAIGIIAVVCTQNLGEAFGAGAPKGYALLAIAAGMIALLAGANIVGVRWGSRIQNVTVYAKLFTLLAITALAVWAGSRRDVDVTTPTSAPVLGGISGVIAALVPAFFAYGGWQQALWITGEVRDPRRIVPRSIIIGVLLVIAVYLLANWAYLRLLGVDGVAHSNALAADAVATQMPGLGRRLVAAAVGVSAFGVLNSQLLSGPRLVYGMAADGRFFRPFAKLSPRFGTPVAAILLLAGMALLLLAVAGPNGIDKLLTGAVFIDGVFFIMTGAAIFVLRRSKASRPVAPSNGAAEAAFRVPLYPIVPLVFIAGQLGGMVGTYLDPAVRQASYIGALWILGAAIIYAVWFRRRT